VSKHRFPDPGLLLTLVLVVLAASPFLLRPGLPRDTDAELHVLRAAEVLSCWQSGVLYPRWAPDFYYGYGYPIFNYYAPLTYHLSALFSLLPGLGIVAGVKAVFCLGLLLGGTGTYLLVRDLCGPQAGVVGTVTFLFAPYVLFIDPHARGDLAEHFAVGLLPLALFFLRRLVEHGGRGALAGTAVGTAALVMSHNLLGTVGLALLLAAFAWQVTVERQRDGIGRGLLGLALGLALSAFFWLPMLAEIDEVQLSVIGGGHFDFRNHFVSPAELLAPSRILDLGAVAPHYRHNLGSAQWLLALAGVGALLKGGTPYRRALSFFAIAGMALVLLITSASRFIWEALPTLAYLQFPWRLLGPAALMLAVCAGAATSFLAHTHWRPAATAGVVLGTLLLALPTMFPFPWEADFGDTSPAGIVRFELQGETLGTTSTGDFVPRRVRSLPRPEQSLVGSYEGAGPVDKVNRVTLPEGTVVEVLEHGPTHDRFRVSGAHNFVFRLYTFMFPGWHVYVDGEEVEIALGKPEGLITFWVSKGEHQVLVRFEDTPPRRAGWWLAGGGLIGLVLALMSVCPARPAPRPGLSMRALAWLAGVVLSFSILKFGLVDRRDTWFRYTSPPGEAWAATYRQTATLDGQVSFLGFDLPRRRVRSGGKLPVVLYWRALEPLTVNYQSFVHLTSPTYLSWGQSDTLNPGGLPTTRWPSERYVWDVHEVQVHPGTPAGEYMLEVGLYTREDGRRLSVVGPDGASMGETVVLEVPVEVLPALCQPDPEGLEMDEEVGAVYDGQIQLLGYAVPFREVYTPGFLHVVLFWQGERDHPDELVVALAVVDDEREPVALASGAPAVGRSPTSSWSRGEVVRDPYAFWLEEDLQPGTYAVGVVVHRGDRPITPEGAEDPFLELFTVEVQRWQE